ncbi:hypothetical protein RvY_10455 [Ramazzottius varieornatus]|uniref:Transmembrane protein 65 n=1 Tax=Ramazzottius varieornatus TaxID=947166 RepID=A0A1D1VCS8_RAMVA|nr:hypothetical protein RvY_10455 [Ramazzottius varieornatus]
MAPKALPRTVVRTIFGSKWNSASCRRDVLRILDGSADVRGTGSLLRRMHSVRIDMTSVPRWRAALTTLRGVDHVVDEEEAKNFVVLLQPSERQLLLKELTSFQGTPASEEVLPSAAELRQLALFCALPFVGFGFLDNFLMIVAGSYIEIGIGSIFTISTMAAAALGNTVSDIAGIGSAGYVERVAKKVGINPPALSAKQADMTRTRWAMNLGRVIGITIGCLLGMCPLLLMNEKPETTVVSVTSPVVILGAEEAVSQAER